jgi:hypothetical protein
MFAHAALLIDSPRSQQPPPAPQLPPPDPHAPEGRLGAHAPPGAAAPRRHRDRGAGDDGDAGREAARDTGGRDHRGGFRVQAGWQLVDACAGGSYGRNDRSFCTSHLTRCQPPRIPLSPPQSTPLNETSVTIDSDFMPIVKEVLGRRMPEVMERAAELQRRAEAAAAAAAAAQAEGGADGGAAAEEQPQQPPAAATAPAAEKVAEEGTSEEEEARAARDEAARAARAEGAAARLATERAVEAAAAGSDPNIKLDDDTLRMVSRAIMGRLDVVDLVGRNTAEEIAERVGFVLLVWVEVGWLSGSFVVIGLVVRLPIW